ncbi:hypothetical protein CK203_003464 [Vitis vinifera]|uniref:Uncharacterized protein n=1 Tax=Vitis vinifera TaxID=29760 RepID=A0A438K7U7_VITVI|nr:hypothetical protein CK203_003464 [Vitis vinifera]
MCCLFMNKLFILLYILGLIFSGLPSSHGDMIDSKVLNVGKELWKETLQLQMGSCLYQLQGLKPYTWYEVKISYPASIPASFSIQLKRGNSDLGLNRKRRLLNTEKLIFKTDNLDLFSIQDGMYVLVTVEPAGVVAIPHTRERELVIFNIVGSVMKSVHLDIWQKVMTLLFSFFANLRLGEWSLEQVLSIVLKGSRRTKAQNSPGA